MPTRMRLFALLAGMVLTLTASAQERDPVSPGVANAVLLATNSIQVDRDGVIRAGDVIVNDVTGGAVLGEKQLSLDRNVRTPLGALVAAHSVDIDRDAVVGGDVHVNVLSNEGTIAGSTVTPLAMPVYSSLPAPISRSTGTIDIVVPPGETVDITEEDGPYASLTIGKGGTARLLGGGYAFTDVIGDKDAFLLCAAACNVFVSHHLSFDQVGTIRGQGVPSSAVSIYVDGANGTPSLTAVPALRFGRNASISANLSAPNGTISFDRDMVGEGSMYARDIYIGRGASLTLASNLNAPPIAVAQSVFTDGAQPLSITLRGEDPEGQPLDFAIASAPVFGSLSAVTPTSSSTASVTYTPSTGGNLLDHFTFSVTDAGGLSGSAVVTINPSTEEPPPPPPGTVVADDLFAAVARDVPETLVLTARAPEGVALTFSIVSGTGPLQGTLGPVTNGTQATVVYTPDSGAEGTDAFEFEACGVISGDTVCDTAVYTLRILTPRVEPPDLAHDIEVTTGVDEPITVAFSDTVLASRSFRVRTNAVFLDSVEVAGTVADSNDDGFGDNHMSLPASVPIFMSAGTGLSGGPGSNGDVRMHFEWDISSFGSALLNSLTAATVNLYTHRGTIDSLPTFFYHVFADGDGALSDNDYENGSAERIRGAIMEVPPSMAVGADGTFAFSVLDELRAAVAAGQDTLIIQGRVHAATGPARGLEVRTSAQLNRDSMQEPQLELATPGVTAPRTYQIISLPPSGTLFDGTTQITTVPYVLSAPQVIFTPATGFTGDVQFIYQIDTDQALVKIRVTATNCSTDPSKCDDGRD